MLPHGIPMRDKDGINTINIQLSFTVKNRDFRLSVNNNAQGESRVLYDNYISH